MTEGWVWVVPDVVRAIHDRQLAEHGGGDGLRDAGLLSSALARPQNAASYGTSDGADLAAAYAFGIAKNHPFMDRDERTAWAVARLFLRLNNCRLEFAAGEAIATVKGLTADSLDEAGLAAWFRARITRIEA
jgi:death on curing protein